MLRIAVFTLLACSGLQIAAGQEQAPGIPALMDAGNASYMRGDYEAARQSFAKAWELAQQQTPQEDPVRYDILKRLTSVRAAAGEFADADAYLQLAINWREVTIGRGDPKIADDLVISAALSRGMKNYDRALEIMERVIGWHRANGAPLSTQADDYSRVAQIHLDQKNLEAAVNALLQALKIRTDAAGPLDRSLVPELDKLGSTYITLRQYDKAEETFRHALVIRETLLGKDDADLIASVDGLAYACFGQKKYDDADALYQRLIGLWTKSLGGDHPMLALALDKVAVFYEEQKKFDQAREASDRAVAIRTSFLGHGLSLAAAEQLVEGKKDEAIALYKRALTVLDPPNEVYNELRSDIADSVKLLEPPPKVPAVKAQPKRIGVKKKQ